MVFILSKKFADKDTYPLFILPSFTFQFKYITPIKLDFSPVFVVQTRKRNKKYEFLDFLGNILITIL